MVFRNPLRCSRLKKYQWNALENGGNNKIECIYKKEIKICTYYCVLLCGIHSKGHFKRKVGNFLGFPVCMVCMVGCNARLGVCACACVTVAT